MTEKLADVFNVMYENKQYIIALGEGILIPFNKPGKEKKLNCMRSITLLNSIRKIFSLVILERIYPSVESYVTHSQSGFRRGHGTIDIAWSYLWLRVTAWRYQRVFHIAGIDMSAAFDSMDRNNLLWIIGNIVPRDEERMIRSLLANITLQVRIGGNLSEPFGITLGISQGDGLSPILFVIYLEGAMKELKAIDGALHGKFHGGYWQEDINEMSYADDMDFINPNLELLDSLMERIPIIFTKYHLKINVAKTERKCLDIKKSIATNYKKLGSHTDIDVDLRLRIQKANLAFHLMWKTWNSKMISFKTRL